MGRTGAVVGAGADVVGASAVREEEAVGYAGSDGTRPDDVAVAPASEMGSVMPGAWAVGEAVP